MSRRTAVDYAAALGLLAQTTNPIPAGSTGLWFDATHLYWVAADTTLTDLLAGGGGSTDLTVEKASADFTNNSASITFTGATYDLLRGLVVESDVPVIVVVSAIDFTVGTATLLASGDFTGTVSITLGIA